MASDKDALVTHLNDREIHDNTLRIPFPYTEADALGWIQFNMEEASKKGHPTSFAIRNTDGELIGGAGFDGLEVGATHNAELGYWLAKLYWGQGIITNVVKKLCEVGFEDFKLHKIHARVFSFNARSARVLEKCGFEKEGYLKKEIAKDGKFIDCVLYALVK